MTLLRNIRRALFGPRCPHQWENTGATYTDSRHGFTVVLRECRLCNQTIMVEV